MTPPATTPRTVPEDVQVQARALGDPTRFRIFRYIVEAARPVDVAELTRYLQLNHNAIRQHLDLLCGAGLVLEATEERHRPGRPRLLYRAAPASAGLWGTPGPYEELARSLAEAMRHDQTAEGVGRRAGLARAAELARQGLTDDALGALEQEMARAGFQPVLRERARGAELVLERCPFVSAAVANAKVVCDVHLGLARGLAEGIGGLVVEDLVRKNPQRAGCRLLVRALPPGDPAPGR